MSSIIADVLSLDGNTIENQILIGDGDDPSLFGAVDRVDPHSAIGWVKTGGVWSAPPSPPPPPPSAYIVTDLQFRLALNQSGLRDAAEAYIASATQDVKDWWDRATHIHSDDAKLNAAVKALGKTAADRDALFTLAATL